MTGWRIALAPVLLFPAFAFGHVRLVSPPPRTTIIGKTPPCAGVPRTSTPTVLMAGQMLQVDWVETIDHPGHYELALSLAADQDFVTLLGDIPDGPFAPGATHRDYLTTLQVPATPCDACTLQLIQFMSDHPPGSQYYYSCTDVRIVGAATTTTTLAGGTTTTTLPPDCSALAATDRATCEIQKARGRPVCEAGVDARFLARFDAGLTAVQTLLDRAAASPSARRTAHLVLVAARRVRRLGVRVATAADRRRIDAACQAAAAGVLERVAAALAGDLP